ncbi:cobalamin B12-binding domain-containing protein [Vallitalea pronyensis]|uniref:Cobalamin B12-binding domain-containing protein n=1 Tax=Vallitalea pronyensis TaxID=1348613 RepID=A0A8J8MHT2_9FIRM|nr:cobalamin-dependent protein [Vallitalea pronyensis]QUI22082.1 cobalamin B12-binding domain-containing protein [Vallitalea pronyensis]
MDIFEKIQTSLIESDEVTFMARIESALERGFEPLEVLNKGLIVGMTKVSKICEKKMIFIPEMLKISEIFTKGYNRLLTLIKTNEDLAVGKVVVACNKDDLHDFGKNIFILALKLKGFHVIDLGIDTDEQDVIDTCIREDADFICLSMTLPWKRKGIFGRMSKIQASGLCERLVVGGAGVDEDFEKQFHILLFENNPYIAADKMYNILIESKGNKTNG